MSAHLFPHKTDSLKKQSEKNLGIYSEENKIRANFIIDGYVDCSENSKIIILRTK